HCYGARAIQGWADNVATEAAKGVLLAVDAVERGQDDGNVLWMAANAMLYLAKDRERSRELVYKSLELNPNSAVAVSVSGVTRARQSPFQWRAWSRRCRDSPTGAWSCSSVRTD